MNEQVRVLCHKILTLKAQQEKVTGITQQREWKRLAAEIVKAQRELAALVPHPRPAAG